MTFDERCAVHRVWGGENGSILSSGAFERLSGVGYTLCRLIEDRRQAGLLVSMSLVLVGRPYFESMFLVFVLPKGGRVPTSSGATCLSGRVWQEKMLHE